MKTLNALGLAVATAAVSLLAGCGLYFGNHGDDDHHPGSGGSSPPGYACDSNADCAAGCYCEDGTCEEGGFCATDADCPSGYHCDTDRSSCEPDPGCATDTDCTGGQVCDPATGTCTDTCSCTSDSEAVQQGFGWCDESRQTCMTGEDPLGACTGDVTCNTNAPHCPEGQVALILDGCYTGQCRAITECESAPACGALTHEDDCLARAADCSAEYTGHGCHTNGGGTCAGGDPGCTCDTFTFATCEPRGPSARITLDSANRPVALPNTSSMQ